MTTTQSRTAFSLLADAYERDEMNPGYIAMRDALLAGYDLTKAFFLEVEVANATGKHGRVRGALELVLNVLEAYERSGTTYVLPDTVPPIVRSAMGMPHGSRRSALALVSQHEQTHALSVLFSLVEKMHKIKPARFCNAGAPEMRETKGLVQPKSGSQAAKRSAKANARHSAAARA